MDRARNGEGGMKCKSERCYSPLACEGFGYCRELNMGKTFHDGKVTLHAGDCLDVLKAMPENSIDAVVTDPPYHLTSITKRFSKNGYSKSNLEQPADKNLDGIMAGSFRRLAKGFMGKQWDGGDIAFTVELWAEVLRVLKPGGHMICFGGTRTYHRMVCAIEDAGFEVRDQLAWVYGSGFPKSHDVSKGIDRAAGVEREIIGRYNGATNVSNAGSGLKHDCYGVGGDKKADSTVFVTTPATDAARQWQGWGTALKPAWEPICLARKPLSESTVAANVMRWGTGAINIDGCRIDAGYDYSELNVTQGGNRSMAFGMAERRFVPAKGRWPANLCHDGSPEVMAGFPERVTSERRVEHDIGRTRQSCYGEPSGAQYKNGNTHGDSGSAARFFYTSKAGSWDRINRVIETLEIEWFTGLEVRLATLQVDTEQLHRKGIVVSPSDTSNEWNTFLSGSNITDLCRKASRCTTKTGTSSTTTSQTWSWLTRLLTKESIQVANCEMVNGSSHAETAGISGPSLTITLGETASLPGASLAASGTQLRISVSAKQHGHPTIKPVNLMQWLVRLVCQKGATVLDPFAGTGTTGAASFIEGRRCVLIEREAEYLADIEKRMGMLLSGSEERSWKLAKPEPLEALPLFALPEPAEWGNLTNRPR
jgi:DNA modification methylase